MKTTITLALCPNPMNGEGSKGIKKVTPSGKLKYAPFLLYLDDDVLQKRIKKLENPIPTFIEIVTYRYMCEVLQEFLSVKSVPDGTIFIPVTPESAVASPQVLNYISSTGVYETRVDGANTISLSNTIMNDAFLLTDEEMEKGNVRSALDEAQGVLDLLKSGGDVDFAKLQSAFAILQSKIKTASPEEE